MALNVLKPVIPNDFVLQHQTEQKLHAILDGTIKFPGNGITGILLYGVPGTEKQPWLIYYQAGLKLLNLQTFFQTTL
jgi:hypothetical protein